MTDDRHHRGDEKGRARARNRGFTLLEMLVVTAILAVLVAAILASVAGGLRVWDRSRSFGKREAEAILAFRLIEKDLMNAAPFFGVPFEGEDGRLTFPSILLPLPGPDATSFVERPGGTSLIWNRERAVLLRSRSLFPQQQAEEEVILDGVREFHFRFFGTGEDAGRRPEWTSRWNSASNMPVAVEIVAAVGDASAPLVLSRRVVLPIDTAKPEKTAP